MEIRWTAYSLNCLNKIEKYLLKEVKLDVDDVKRITQLLKSTPGILLQFPKIGQSVNVDKYKKLRRLLVKNYKIFYELRSDTIFILKVLHVKEDIEG